MPSLQNSNAGLFSSLTWDDAVLSVSSAASGSHQAENLAVARQALRETIQYWNSRKRWQFLQVTADDITLVAGTDTYDLPTNFAKPYGALLSGSETPLHYLPLRLWNQFTGGYSTSGRSCYYTLFNSPTTGQVRLLPPPDNAADGPLKVHYYRNIIDVAGGSDYLDILSAFEGALLAGARFRYLAMKGDESAKISVWSALAEQGLSFAISTDNDIPDESIGFVPGSAFPVFVDYDRDVGGW